MIAHFVHILSYLSLIICIFISGYMVLETLDSPTDPLAKSVRWTVGLVVLLSLLGTLIWSDVEKDKPSVECSAEKKT